MKITPQRRILKDDLDRIEKTPKWVDALIDPLNTFLESVSSALLNNLSFADNFATTKITVPLTDSIEKQVNPQTTRRVNGVLLMEAGGALVTGFGWRQTPSGQLGLTVKFNTIGATNDCTLQLFY